MAKYGGLTGPGSHGFPGWPSKVPGAPSGGGRYNANPGRSLPPPYQSSLQDVLLRNQIVNGRWLVPPGFISCTGSKYAKKLCFLFNHYGPKDQLGSFELFTECIAGKHRRWLNGGDQIYFPFSCIYQIANAEQPGEAYDNLVHNNIHMPYLPEKALPDWSKEVFSIQGAPGSSEPDPRIMDENVVIDGMPLIGTCSIPVTGSQDLSAMVFDHKRPIDTLYVIEKSGRVLGYNGCDLPFALIQLMVRADEPGAFYEIYLKGLYPVNHALHIVPDRLKPYIR